MGKRSALVISTRLRSWIEAAPNATTRIMSVSSIVRVVMLPQQRGCMKQADVAGAATPLGSTVSVGSQRNGAILYAG
tara:strand:- start:164 stop:394 length:231 start_codon:yes stop_codon:yes gene_type:complete